MMSMVVPVVSMVFFTASLSILAHGEGSQAENSLKEKYAKQHIYLQNETH